MSAAPSDRPVHRWQRAENALIAAGILVAVIAWGQPWWLPLAAFLIFDLSALGYLAGEKIGAFCYNVVHNYAAPAALVIIWAALRLGGVDARWLALLAACWGFHIAVDRALGYGLKLGPFTHTHLGIIGAAAHTKERRDDASPQWP